MDQQLIETVVFVVVCVFVFVFVSASAFLEK